MANAYCALGYFDIFCATDCVVVADMFSKPTVVQGRFVNLVRECSQPIKRMAQSIAISDLSRNRSSSMAFVKRSIRG